MDDARLQIDAIHAMESCEDRDVDFLLKELREAPDREGKREAVRRFRRQIIRVAATVRS